METIDLDTVQGRTTAFAEFCRRHPPMDPQGEFASLIEGVGKTGSPEAEAAVYRKIRDTVRPLKVLVVIAWNALESAQNRAFEEAKARHARLGWEFSDDKLAFDWDQGERAYRLSVNLANAIEAAREPASPRVRAHLQAGAVVHARELLRVMSDAFTPARKPQETEDQYNARTSGALFAGTQALQQYFNFAWVKGQPEVSMRIVRDTLSHGDALINEGGLLVYRRAQKDTQLVTNQHLQNYLNLALATYDVAAMDAVRVRATLEAHLDREVRPFLKPWDEFVGPSR